MDLYRITKKISRRRLWQEDNYRRLEVIIDCLWFCLRIGQVLLSGDLNYVNKENLKALKDDTEDVERMLKALIKSLEDKHLDP
ncbi:MAG: hypothetical protein ACERKP_07025 [Deltaproteobacteria bacterium]